MKLRIHFNHRHNVLDRVWWQLSPFKFQHLRGGRGSGRGRCHCCSCSGRCRARFSGGGSLRGGGGDWSSNRVQLIIRVPFDLTNFADLLGRGWRKAKIQPTKHRRFLQ